MDKVTKENLEVYVNTSNEREEEHSRTPLHYAVQNGHKDVLKILVKSGADINALDSCDSSALHLLTEQIDTENKDGLDECLEYLLEQDSRFTLKFKDEK